MMSSRSSTRVCRWRQFDRPAGRGTIADGQRQSPSPWPAIMATVDDEPEVEQAVAELFAAPVILSKVAEYLPRTSGVYAWWAQQSVFEALNGPSNPAAPFMRLVYVGIAANLRVRIVRNHLRRSGSSTLRRTLAGLLLHTEGYRTMWTDRVVLVPEDEDRLTTWMHQNLGLTWIERADPRPLEDQLIRKLLPPLNIDGAAAGLSYEAVRHARRAYRASAGPRPAAPA